MPVKVKDAATAATKFAQRAAAAAPDYAAGVRGAGQDWQAAAVAAAENYAAAVTEAIGRNAFARGVQAAGAQTYEQRAATVGARRFPEGVREAQPRWQEEVQPYLQTIAGLTLPPRRPKGDPANFARVQAIGEALRRRKLAGS
ncbi:MAG: hypothetical protein K6W08_07370 [Firmicutes bacterium]|nr:hypothetical protein [Bacillota bacterium]